MTEEATPKPKKKLLDRTLSAANKALEAAEDLVDMAQDTAKSVVDAASDTARSTLQFTTDSAQVLAMLAGGGVKMTTQLASEAAKAATHLAQEAALQMAQTYFSKTTLTVAVTQSQLNKQLRQMSEGHPYIDHITVECGSDRLTVALDGHYQRLMYTLSLDFDVLECKVSHDEQFLLLRHVNTNLDAQLRQAKTLSNLALRGIARGTAFAVKKLPPMIDPVAFFLEQIEGVSGEGANLWRVALHKNLLMELLFLFQIQFL